MRVRITIEYDTDDDSTLEQQQADWIAGDVGFLDVWELAKDGEASGYSVRFDTAPQK